MSDAMIQVSVFTDVWEPTTPSQCYISRLIKFVDAIRHEWAKSPDGVPVIRRNPMYIGYVALKIAAAHAIKDYDDFEKDVCKFVSDGIYQDPHTWSYSVWPVLSDILMRHVYPYLHTPWGEQSVSG